MNGVREAQAADIPALDGLIDAVVGMPERARSLARAAVRTNLERAPSAKSMPSCLVAQSGGVVRAFVCVRTVALAPHAVDVDWLFASGDDAASLVTELVSALHDGRCAGASSVRFLSGRWQRGGLDSHVLDAAGMSRAGAIDAFYGRGDDLIVFVARSEQRRPEAFDPASPAALCDAAFAYRDFGFERDFLLACAAQYGSRKVRRAASWGCWAGRHVLALAEKGVDGIGIDDCSEALSLADALFREGDDGATTATWVLARLDDQVLEPPVDLSYAMLSAVHRVGSAESLVRHLRSVADLLLPGGVHVIEATLPADATPEGNTQTVWTEGRGELEITSRFRILVERRARFGAVPAVLDVRCRKRESQEVVGTFHQDELWIVPDADGWRELVARAGRFELVALLGDFQLDVRWDQPGAWRMIAILRRTEES